MVNNKKKNAPRFGRSNLSILKFVTLRVAKTQSAKSCLGA